MSMLRNLLLLPAVLILASCSLMSKQGTLAELRDVKLVLEDATVDNGLEKAMESYRAFLEETPESAMTPEAIRRIADLSIEKEYGYVSDGAEKSQLNANTSLDKPDTERLVGVEDDANVWKSANPDAVTAEDTDLVFEAQATAAVTLDDGDATPIEHPQAPVTGLENANAQQAIDLYRKLLRDYPFYDRNDQVLYQMSRAYEELGQTDEAMKVMNQFIAAYPQSRYMDEVQFRRAEFYFTRKKYLDAEEAYQSIVKAGPGSYYYELAVYKLGWSFYKQGLYEEALNQYIALLDYKVSNGYDFHQQGDPIESKRVEDTFRVISLSFSNLGGPEVVVDFFNRNGERGYEDKVYSNLGEFYLDKRRYADSAGSYNAFIAGHPFHEVSPKFSMRIIDIYKAGRFARLVIDAKREFSKTYALNAEYWQHFDINQRPEVVDYLKVNLKDLANHYHALYQDQRFVKDKEQNYSEALVWYHKYLESFPREQETPAIHYLMADLMLENQDYGKAAAAYEYTAYNYPQHEKSSAAGYAAVYAYREHLAKLRKDQMNDMAVAQVQQEIIRTSLKFADAYPEHEKVTLVLGAAADDLYEMKNYELAVTTAKRLIDQYAEAATEIRRSAWLVVAHGSFDMKNYADAEHGYLQVLDLTTSEDDTRKDVIDTLAASIYKQGELASAVKDYQLAAKHFLRVGQLAPTSKIRPNAEFDAATALIELQSWQKATEVLLAFREAFPEHELQHDITKKIAFVYKSDGKYELAGAEYERIERESKDEAVRRGALLLAAELYEEGAIKQKELAVYKRFVKYFPSPLENAMEIYNKMGELYLSMNDKKSHVDILKTLVKLDNNAGDERTDRTQYLAATASLVLTRPLFDSFAEVEIVEPVEKSIARKKKLMQAAIKGYTKLIDYGVADVTAASTYYMAEIYFNFSQALMHSERPSSLSPLELEEYELALEEKIYPFEEKAIEIHRKNVELLYMGIYSQWIDKSVAKLAATFPALYARDEEHIGFIDTIDRFHYDMGSKRDIPESSGARSAEHENKVSLIGVNKKYPENAIALAE